MGMNFKGFGVVVFPLNAGTCAFSGVSGQAQACTQISRSCTQSYVRDLGTALRHPTSRARSERPVPPWDRATHAEDASRSSAALPDSVHLRGGGHRQVTPSQPLAQCPSTFNTLAITTRLRRISSPAPDNSVREPCRSSWTGLPHTKMGSTTKIAKIKYFLPLPPFCKNARIPRMAFLFRSHVQCCGFSCCLIPQSLLWHFFSI